MSRETRYTCEMCKNEVTSRFIYDVLIEKTYLPHKGRVGQKWQVPEKYVLKEDLCEGCFKTLERFFKEEEKP